MAKSKLKTVSVTKSPQLATKVNAEMQTKVASPNGKTVAIVKSLKALPKREEKAQVILQQQVYKRSSPRIGTVFFQFVKLQLPIILTLFVLILLLCEEDDKQIRMDDRISGPKPEPLLNYEQFKEFYPRIGKNVQVKETENSNRELLFNADSIAVARHNLAFIVKNFTYLVKQSPFRSDRTLLEQMEILRQLDEFNYTKLDSLARNVNDSAASEKQQSNSGIIRVLIRYLVSLLTFKFGYVDGHKSGYFEMLNDPLNEDDSISNNLEMISNIDADLRILCSGKIKDQKNCGASYAFAWNSYAEWHYCKQTGKQVEFSEQFIVDCGHLANLKACSDGRLSDVREFSQLFGFQLEKNYPNYKEIRGNKLNCKKRRENLQVESIDFTKLIIDRQQWEKILFEQPILVELNLPSDIMDYESGIHDGDNCNEKLAHTMLLVGHGREQGKLYWILKNSMGKNWGENGYLRLSRDSKALRKCFKTGYISKFKFKSVNEERFNSFYNNIKFRPSSQSDSNDQVNKEDAFDWYE